MIEKVAIMAAVRDTFSGDVGGFYTTNEMERAAPIDVTSQGTQEDVIAYKQAQIENWQNQKMQQEEAQAEPTQEEQTELLDENGELVY